MPLHLRWLLLVFDAVSVLWDPGAPRMPLELENCDLGSTSVWRTISTRTFNERVGQKLRRIILLHIGLQPAGLKSGD